MGETAVLPPPDSLADGWGLHQVRTKRQLLDPPAQRSHCLPRWWPQRSTGSNTAQVSVATTINEEEICLCPKTGPCSGQVTRDGVRIRPPPSTNWCLLLHRVLPAIAMALLCATVWASVHYQISHPKPQPGVRDGSFKPPHSLLSRAFHDFHAQRSPRSLPTLPAFSVDHEDQPLDTQLERLLDVYCRGPLLHAVQMTNVFPDSKHFVDMPIKSSSSVFQVLMDFENQRLSLTEFQPSSGESHHHSRSHREQLRHFLEQHFDPPGSDLLPITPFDFHEYTLPPMIAGIQDEEQREWALALHGLWRYLGRMPQTHTNAASSFLHAKPLNDPHLHRQQNVLIVPGGRFRESYYWDSYWIVQGLLVSDMRGTARGVVNNLLEYVAEFGFVPNGGRIYYLNRSQPPMLSDMVQLVARMGHSATSVQYDASYLRSAVPILEQEYAFWMQRGPGGHAVTITRNSTTSYVLNRFISHANHPRPESYREDVAVAAEIFGDTVLADHGDARETLANKAKYYNDVIAAAESGWDFSSRWLRDPLDVRSIFTSCVVPVDLNAVIYRMERNMAVFHSHLGNSDRSAYFTRQAAKRMEAMDAVLWSDACGCWKDYDLESDRHSKIVSVSDYTPLWARAFDADNATRLHLIVKSLETSGLLQVGGIQTTTTFTGQQWDAPNAWPPEQDMIIEGLLAANTPDAHDLARALAKTWIHTSLTAWRETGLMFEKYNATEVGGLGVGGEYFPQFGFGWTNGVILKMLTIHQNLLVT